MSQSLETTVVTEEISQTGWQDSLCAGGDGNHAGRCRRTQQWAGGARPASMNYWDVGKGGEHSRWQLGRLCVPYLERSHTCTASPLPPRCPVTMGTGHLTGRRAPARAEGGGGAMMRLQGGLSERAAFLPSGLGSLCQWPEATAVASWFLWPR